MEATNQCRFSRGLIAPHLAWKESILPLVCYAIPAASVRREGRPVSGTGRPLVTAAVQISTAVAIRRGYVVGVCVMGTRMCDGVWRNTDSERHDERNPGFVHHEFLLKSARFQRLSDKAAAREPLSRITAPCPLTLRCDHKSLCDKLHR